ncbi:Crp/Fnr family transcriptional regulator [Fibrobacter sp. UBA4309]|uniref:Crp/Fnr family transcriptional regulator n=1 Tax=Fibrobacter sp. UBA4309 TaxID=1946537 RepID=UPI0025BE80A0|nr:Crp/Fnr family transcriptional regulator [Fibrobacter sp. UBA4309]
MQIAVGEYLCLEGDKANSLYIVKSGMLVGFSKATEGAPLQNFGPGSIIGEFSLLESAAHELTLRAAEDTVIEVIEQGKLQSTLDKHPNWLRSILTFLTSRCHIAEENKKKSDMIQALPSLLYILSSHIQETGSDSMPLELLQKKVIALNNSPAEETDRLLASLQNLGLLKVSGEQDKVVRAESLQTIPLLYETLRYRALNQKVSPNILSMTEQMVLSTFVKIARDSNVPQHNGLCTITTEQLKAEAKKSMHGLTLTSRTIAPLVEKNLLEPSNAFDIHAPLEQVSFFFADFEKILDLLELNRIFPLLDKNLV